MKPNVYTCIKRWREKNPDKYGNQLAKSNFKSNAWKTIAREFRRILHKP